MKTAFLEQAIERLPSRFAISDLVRVCSSISRDMIRVVLNRLRKEGRLLCRGTGRREFQKLASELVKRNEPAEIRTAISRAYYATHNVGAEILTGMGFEIVE
ncbi:MAG: hypothetical protein V2A69_05245, partial [Pseudomonadota bacterium]